MKTKQAAAIIGASGQMGSALAKAIAKGNYRVILQSVGTDKVQSVMDEIKNSYPFADVEYVHDMSDACWEADIIIMAVPYSAEKNVAENIKNVANQKTVISISNPVNDNYDGLATVKGLSAAEELQEMLPYAKVVKAFNTTLAGNFCKPAVNDLQIDCFIAGNDEEALQVTYDLVKTAGFQPIVTGDLSASRILESMQLLLIRLAMQNDSRKTAGWKILHH